MNLTYILLNANGQRVKVRSKEVAAGLIDKCKHRFLAVIVE